VAQSSALYVTNDADGDVMLLDQRRPTSAVTNHSTAQVCPPPPNVVFVPDYFVIISSTIMIKFEKVQKVPGIIKFVKVRRRLNVKLPQSEYSSEVRSVLA